VYGLDDEDLGDFHGRRGCTNGSARASALAAALPPHD
jgi:hypothetical protein